MSLMRAAALYIPAIRRLRDSRDALLQERDSLLQRPTITPWEDREAAESRIARSEGRLIITEYPYYTKSRAIEDASGGRRIVTRFESEEDRYAEALNGISKHIGALLRIPREQKYPDEPFWANDWFPPMDGASLYGLIAEHAPARYIEVGSGISTRFARRAIRDLGLKTRIVSIDPHPHTVIDKLCDEVVRCPMEDVPSDFWADIGPNDMLFVDNSHRSFSNSDVTVFFAEVLPGLPPGTIWGLHDILLPWDYPAAWSNRFYNEQYLLLAYLLGGAGADRTLLPVKWASSRPRLHGILAQLWARLDLFRDVGTHGGCFWMRRGPESFAAAS